MKNRLQFKHVPNIFENISEIRDHIDYRIETRQEEYLPLYGEPVIFRYKGKNFSEDNKKDVNVVLAIGGIGIGETEAGDYHYHLIDTFQNEEDIKVLYEKIAQEISDREEGDEWLKEFTYNLIQGEGAIKVEDTSETGRTVSLKINNITNDILTQDKNHGLKATIDLNFNADEKLIELKDANGKVFSSIDASVFIKDGFLEKAEVINTEEEQRIKDPEGIGFCEPPYLYLKWNVGAEKNPDIIRIPLSKLIDIYTAGDGLSLSENEFSIKIDPESETFLTVSANGLRLNGVGDSIDEAKKEATTKVIKNTHASHIVLTSEKNADNSTTYAIDESNIASDDDLQSFKTDVDSDMSALHLAIAEEIAQAVANEAHRIDDIVGSGFTEETITHKVNNKVEKVDGYSLVEDSEIEKLANIEPYSQENVIERIKVDGEIVEVSDKTANIELPINAIADTDKMLVINDKALTSMFSVDYDSSAKKIYFYGKNNSVIGTVDTTDFVVDGMIKNIEVVSRSGVKYLQFTFNTDAGEKVFEFKLTELAGVYTVAEDSVNYLKIDDNLRIGAKVDSPDYSGLVSGSALHNLDDKYAQITENINTKVGEGFVDESGQTISVTHAITELAREVGKIIDRNDMVFTEDFKVAGIMGTLGTGEIKNGDIIKKGTSVLSVLKLILQKRLEPEGVLPTATIKLLNPGVYEVGDSISPTYEITFDPGKYEYADGGSGITNITVSQYKVRTLDGSTFSTEMLNTRTGSFLPTVMADNTNIKVFADLDYTNNGYIPEDNLGKKVESKQIPNGSINNIENGSITSYRPCFYGSVMDSKIVDPSNISQEEIFNVLTKHGSCVAPTSITVDAGSELVIIMIPNTHSKITKIMDGESHLDLLDSTEMHQQVIKTYRLEEEAITGYYVYVYNPETALERTSTYYIAY